MYAPSGRVASLYHVQWVQARSVRRAPGVQVVCA
jgi:hypothetical protein